jgi:hypothetical protein
MQKPKLYIVHYRDHKGNSKTFETNDENTALKKEIITSGQTYIDTRYKAKLRLYNFINRIK